MSVQIVEVEGFEVEIVDDIRCNRGGNHRELVDRARIDRISLGQDVHHSAVLCIRCLKAISLKA